MSQGRPENPTAARPAAAECERLYRQLRRIRRVEEEIARIYPSDKIKSPIHLSIGQEAVSVGVCDALREDDVVSGTYRGHALYLAKGGDLPAMMAELFGKATGCARGRGGSMHLVATERHFLGTSAVVGTTLPVALGFALALKGESRGRIVAAFFGDGATEEGVFAECLNFAALRRLPVLFVCENNFYSIHAPLEKRWATKRLCERVETYGIPAQQIAEGDVFAIRSAAASAVARIRAGEGSGFLECHTYRWREHVGPNEDYDAGYRSRAELEPWRRSDPVEKLAAMVDPEARRRIDAAIEREIAEAVAFAKESPFPDPRDLHADVFAD